MSSRRRRSIESVPCPHCGEYIPTNSSFCRHCGSDRQTGWADEEEIAYQSVVLPEDEGGILEPRLRSSRLRFVSVGAVLGLVAMSLIAGIATIFVLLLRGC